MNIYVTSGMTLLATACGSQATEHLVAQIKYLISKGADATIKDTEQRSPLHHIASVNVFTR